MTTAHLHPVHALLLRGLQTRRHVLDGREDGLAAAPPRVPAASAALAASTLTSSAPSVPATPVLTVSLLLGEDNTLYRGIWQILSYEIFGLS